MTPPASTRANGRSTVGISTLTIYIGFHGSTINYNVHVIAMTARPDCCAIFGVRFYMTAVDDNCSCYRRAVPNTASSYTGGIAPYIIFYKNISAVNNNFAATFILISS